MIKEIIATMIISFAIGYFTGKVSLIRQRKLELQIALEKIKLNDEVLR